MNSLQIVYTVASYTAIYNWVCPLNEVKVSASINSPERYRTLMQLHKQIDTQMDNRLHVTKNSKDKSYLQI